MTRHRGGEKSNVSMNPGMTCLGYHHLRDNNLVYRQIDYFCNATLLNIILKDRIYIYMRNPSYRDLPSGLHLISTAKFHYHKVLPFSYMTCKTQLISRLPIYTLVLTFFHLPFFQSFYCLNKIITKTPSSLICSNVGNFRLYTFCIL